MKLNINKNCHLIEASRGDLVLKSRHQGKQRFLKRLGYQVTNFRGVDLKELFENDYFVFNTPIGDYVCTLAFPGVFTALKDAIKETKGDIKEVTLQMIIKALSKAFDDTDDIKVRCTCLDFCLAPETEIKLLEGKSIKVEDLLKEFESGRTDLWVYSVDPETHDFRPGHISDVWVSGYATELIEVTLDNGEVIRTTPNHYYMLRNGEYKKAEDLEEGQSLMPLYFQNNSRTNGYETVKYNSRSHGYNSVYKEVAQYELRDKIEEAVIRSGEANIAIHHKNFNKNDNRPENLHPMGKYEHWMYHANFIKDRRKEDPEFDQKCREASRKHCYELNANPTEALIRARSELGKAQCAKINNNPEKRAEVSKIVSEYSSQYWSKMTPEERSAEVRRRQALDPELPAKISNGQKSKWASYSDEERAARNKINGITLNGINGEKASERTRRYWKLATPEQYEKYCKRNSDNLKKSWSKDPDKFIKGRSRKVLQRIVDLQLEMTEEVYLKIKPKNAPRPETCWSSFQDMIKDLGFSEYNHSVVSVKRVHCDKAIPVYDLTVDNYNNFLVSAGVVLHNCYRFMYWSWRGNYLYGEPDPGTKEFPKVTNPDNKLGATCKHLDLLLSDKRWITKAASVINSFIKAYPEKAAANLYDEDEIEPEPEEEPEEVEVEVDETEEEGDSNG